MSEVDWVRKRKPLATLTVRLIALTIRLAPSIGQTLLRVSSCLAASIAALHISSYLVSPSGVERSSAFHALVAATCCSGALASRLTRFILADKVSEVCGHQPLTSALWGHQVWDNRPEERIFKFINYSIENAVNSKEIAVVGFAL